MEISIVNKKDNPLLGRTEVHFKVDHASAKTPTRDEVRDKLAALLNTKKQLVVVDHMASSFGRAATAGYARVYPNAETIGKLERGFLLKRNGLSDLAPKAKKPKGTMPAGQEAKKKAAAPKKR